MKNAISIWDSKIINQALAGSVRKLDPRKMLKNPVMFVVEVGALFLSIKLLLSIFSPSAQSSFGFEIQITLWRWFTVLFANFAEAMAEGRGKAQADTLRKSKT
ncbi:MAG: potassium-transporting ATPase subunit B, partial [Pyrinomonadaceae bacterium]